MKQTVFVAIVVAIVFLAIGRLTAPKQGENNQPRIDSLERDIKAREWRETTAIDSMLHYKMMAETWFYEAEKAKKGKVIIRTIYRNEIKTIDRLNSAGIDSALLKRYGADSVK